MKIYAVNLCTDTKNTDRYDKVSVNKFPMIIKCNDIEELKQILSNHNTTEFIKNNIKQKHLYDTAVFYVRELDGNNISEFCINVIDVNNIDY